MSKSRGNVINPDSVIAEYGADTLRLYEMFMGPLQMAKPWATGGLAGIHRFLNRMWDIGHKPHKSQPLEELFDPKTARELRCLLHQSIRKVSEDTAALELNTAISQLMIFSHRMASLPCCPLELWRPFVLLLSPYAPHLGEELWKGIEGTGPTLAYEPWPEWEEALCRAEEKEVVFQINGKLRSKAVVRADIEREELLAAAKADPKIREQLQQKTVRKEIVVPGKLVNFVVGP